ncbi:DUF1516 family protein [Fictibacillus sp. Mic-4]|uniref:DUF1516 family protein n=1 Tax=Fictibacillus TaxID=1329200 RepID=UPI000419F768|nr:DUF1516 family protein [Fictibacillus gelatini]
MFNGLYHAHADTWIIMIVLFVIAFFLLKAGKLKAGKIIHMILRLFYVIMVVSGIGLLISIHFQPIYIIKGLLALWLIGTMEMLLARTKGNTNKPTAVLWIFIVIVLIVIVSIGKGFIHF